jgi:enoyl-CoA hydratase
MSLLRIDRSEGVATLTLDDPEHRNNLTLPLVGELVAAFDELEADDAVGAVVITGAPPAFCSGASLGDLSTITEEGLRAVYEGFLRASRCTLPTIAAVNGAAVGAGVNLALVCDVRLAARSSRFDARFLQIGLHPGGGHTWMTRAIAGPQVVAATVLFGEVLSGEEAQRLGLALRCVPDDELLASAQEMAARAASYPRELVVRTKATLRTMAGVTSHPEAVEVELVPQVWSTQQPFAAERMAALRSRISTTPR